MKMINQHLPTGTLGFVSFLSVKPEVDHGVTCCGNLSDGWMTEVRTRRRMWTHIGVGDDQQACSTVAL